jgi:hypothetical protein
MHRIWNESHSVEFVHEEAGHLLGHIGPAQDFWVRSERPRPSKDFFGRGERPRRGAVRATEVARSGAPRR